MKLLTDRQKARLRQIVRDRHLALIVSICGADAIPKEDFARLSAAKMIKVPVHPIDFVTAAHLLGDLMHDMAPKYTQGLTPEAFWRMSTARKELTDAEEAAVSIAKETFAEHVLAMGDKVVHTMMHTIAKKRDDEQKKYLTGKERKALARGMRERMLVKEIAEELQDVAKGTFRDWERLVTTEIHNRVEEGKAVALVHHKQGDPLVYKRPRPDACPYCKLLFLKPNGVPRVFPLSTLLANGSNIGRKAGAPSKGKTGLKATLGAVHPLCRCSLQYLPSGYGFDSTGKLVEMKKSFIEIETLDRAHLNHACTHG